MEEAYEEALKEVQEVMYKPYPNFDCFEGVDIEKWVNETMDEQKEEEEKLELKTVEEYLVEIQELISCTFTSFDGLEGVDIEKWVNEQFDKEEDKDLNDEVKSAIKETVEIIKEGIPSFKVEDDRLNTDKKDDPNAKEEVKVEK